MPGSGSWEKREIEMAEEEEEEEEEAVVMYKDREEWKGVVPIESDEGPNAAAVIMSSPVLSDRMGYFRYVIKENELSPRALTLTHDVIDLNPANYTAWHWRRLCLFDAKVQAQIHAEEIKRNGGGGSAQSAIDIEQTLMTREVGYVSKMATETPKNYQIWYHRRAVVDKLAKCFAATSPAPGAAAGAAATTTIKSTKPPFSESDAMIGRNELDFTAKILEGDSKNYHAWSHRQWSIDRFSLCSLGVSGDGKKKELAFAESLIKEDSRNNSAWNQRWFVLSFYEVPQLISSKEAIQGIREREIRFAMKHMELTPNNESPFNYARGIVQLIGFTKEVRDALDGKTKYQDFPFLREFLLSFRKSSLAQGDVAQACAPPLLGMLVDIHEELGETDAMKTLVNSLATKFDPVRKRYWKSRLVKKMHP